MEELRADGPGQERFPHLAWHGLGLARIGVQEEIFGAAVPGLGDHHRQARQFLILAMPKSPVRSSLP